ELVHLGMAPLPPEAIVDGAIMDGGAVSGALQQILDEHKVGVRDVAVAVSGHSVIIKPIKMPVMKPQELAESIQWEAEQHIPYAIDDVYLDYEILSNPPGAVEMELLLVAVKRDIISEYLTVVSSAGLNVAVVDVDAFAMANAYEASYEVDPDEVVALLHVGAAVTTITIVKGGSLLFTRDSVIGGSRYNESIQKMLGLSYEQAETLKMGGQVEGYTGADAQPAIDLVNAELSGEIRRSIDFFRSASPSGTIHRMMASGGVARLPRFVPSLGETLELPVEIVNPLRHVRADSKQFDQEYLEHIAPQLSVGIGLALREVGDR
ncbi:MAG: type IV pilus assembly protein PilM, partial [Candidatus Methylomirabilales bacterium]